MSGTFFLYKYPGGRKLPSRHVFNQNSKIIPVTRYKITDKEMKIMEVQQFIKNFGIKREQIAKNEKSFTAKIAREIIFGNKLEAPYIIEPMLIVIDK